MTVVAAPSPAPIAAVRVAEAGSVATVVGGLVRLPASLPASLMTAEPTEGASASSAAADADADAGPGTSPGARPGAAMRLVQMSRVRSEPDLLVSRQAVPGRAVGRRCRPAGLAQRRLLAGRRRPGLRTHSLGVGVPLQCILGRAGMAELLVSVALPGPCQTAVRSGQIVRYAGH